jgi:hypothetical protein
MKGHALRPVYVVVGVVALILVARAMFVPEDFGTHERGYMYGWHRKANEEEWKQFKVKYKSSQYCKGCHMEKHSTIMQSPHAIIQCENCHGPAVDHPVDPGKLSIIRTRAQCLRCHAKLPDRGTGRALIPGINDEKHNPGMECITCHNPHKPGFG